VLIDVEDVALGHTTKLRWNDGDKWLWSEKVVQPPVVGRETFDQVQAMIADPDDKAEIFRQLGLKLTYHPGRRLMEEEIKSPCSLVFRECPRGDLNSETREISPIRGNFHEPSISANARRRHAVRVSSRFQSRAAGRESQAGAAREAGVQGFQPTDVQWPRRSRSALPLEPGQAEYPPFCTAAPISSELAPMTQIGMICVRLCV